jgi:hypothetical protein
LVDAAYGKPVHEAGAATVPHFVPPETTEPGAALSAQVPVPAATPPAGVRPQADTGPGAENGSANEGAPAPNGAVTEPEATGPSAQNPK